MRRRILKTCWRFFDNDFAFLFLHHDLAAFLVQAEWSCGIGHIVNDNQGMLFGKAVDVECHEGVGHGSVHQQAVVHIDAEALAGEVLADLDVVPAFVSYLLVGVRLGGICQVQEQDRDKKHGDEEYGVENHEVLVRILSFSAHIFHNFLQNYKKKRENIVALRDNLYFCSEMDEWWGLIKPFFYS